MKRCVGCLLLFCAVSMFAAPQPGKQPWQWTDEERLAVRFDPHAMAERSAAYAASKTQSLSVGSPSSTHALKYVIDGRRNPELFMRHELVDDLLRGFAPEPQGEQYRQAINRHLKMLGFDPSGFWVGLAEASHSYLVSRREVDARGHGRTGADENALCAARLGMLTAAEKRFGKERFDQFLYTAIGSFRIHTESTTYPDPAGRLRREAGGCK